MRVVGGDLRGRRLAGPVDDGGRTRLRPTSDRMREAIFNILAHGDYPAIVGARVLDLFAGTGAMGIEALSRGAREAVFVDNGREARELLKQNIDVLGLGDRSRILMADATRFRDTRSDTFDLVFCDAPYDRGLSCLTLENIVSEDILSKGAAILVETGADEALDIPPVFETALERRYGAGKIRILRVAEERDRDT